MKTRFLFLAILVVLTLQTRAQNDSVDVIDYTLNLDIDHHQSNTIEGCADITLRLLRPVDNIALQLYSGSVDSVFLGSTATTFTFDRSIISIPAAGLSDTQHVRIYYRTGGFVESGGFGGFHMNLNIQYNLGIGFYMNPFPTGRTWFPCRDNFYDKATYHLTLTSKVGWRALCSGIRTNETVNDDLSVTTSWAIENLTPTYLVGVAIAPFHVIERTYHGLYGDYPATIGFTTHDSLAVMQAYDILDSVVPMYERCFGPYRWGRIGYAATPEGSMEHVCNIALVSSCMASMSQTCQSTICHELGHAWFGNLVTCAAPNDMWINEGGASFCAEVAFEGAHGRAYADRYYNTTLESVLRTNHISDGGYYPLHGIPNNLTYSGTTYRKGHMVWHSLRGYLGDSLFYSSMRTLFARNAFGNMDAYSLRDSLSLYSGVDLNGFWDFHVFDSGFVDYVIDSLTVSGNTSTITIHQQLRGSYNYATANRVPVTFFDANRNSSKQWLLFDGISTTQTFSLPFAAAYAVIDYDREISDAVTDYDSTLAAGRYYMFDQEHAYFLAPDNDSLYVHVAHHWTDPQGTFPSGVTSVAHRFWTVNCTHGGTARFQFAAPTSSTSPYLDEDFYTAPATMYEHLGLLYRHDAREPWQLVSKVRKGGRESGFLETSNLRSGEYTLALVDSTVGIGKVEVMHDFISPNPSHGRFSVELPNPGCTLYIYSITGKLVAEYQNVKKSVNLKHLAPATYVARMADRQGRIIATQKLIIQ